MISSRHNASIKSIRALQSRRERDRAGLYFVEGIRIVAEAVKDRALVEQLIVAPDLLTSAFGQDLVRQYEATGAPCLTVTADVFESISSKDGPQGLAAVVRQRWVNLAEIQPGRELCWVALQEIQDPGNLGTILRTCDAVGAAGVILLGATTDPYDPAAVRASMGAVFSQRLIRASHAAFIRWAGERRMTVVGTSDAASVDYQAVTYSAPLALLMGSEQHGLTAAQQADCSVVVRIPMAGRSDSLNLAVATGVLLYEVFNQRRVAQPADRPTDSSG